MTEVVSANKVSVEEGVTSVKPTTGEIQMYSAILASVTTTARPVSSATEKVVSAFVTGESAVISVTSVTEVTMEMEESVIPAENALTIGT